MNARYKRAFCCSRQCGRRKGVRFIFPADWDNPTPPPRPTSSRTGSPTTPTTGCRCRAAIWWTGRSWWLRAQARFRRATTCRRCRDRGDQRRPRLWPHHPDQHLRCARRADPQRVGYAAQRRPDRSAAGNPPVRCRRASDRQKRGQVHFLPSLPSNLKLPCPINPLLVAACRAAALQLFFSVTPRSLTETAMCPALSAAARDCVCPPAHHRPAPA